MISCVSCFRLDHGRPSAEYMIGICLERDKKAENSKWQLTICFGVFILCSSCGQTAHRTALFSDCFRLSKYDWLCFLLWQQHRKLDFWGWLRLLIVALPGLFYLLFSPFCVVGGIRNTWLLIFIDLEKGIWYKQFYEEQQAFVAGWLQGHWWGFIGRNYVVWPTFLLMNDSIALKGSHFWFLIN